MVTLCTGTISDEKSIGLRGNAAYGVIEAVEYQGHKYFLLKNPWGSDPDYQWNGKLAMSDCTWNSESLGGGTGLKQALWYDTLLQ